MRIQIGRMKSYCNEMHTSVTKKNKQKQCRRHLLKSDLRIKMSKKVIRTSENSINLERALCVRLEAAACCSQIFCKAADSRREQEMIFATAKEKKGWILNTNHGFKSEALRSLEETIKVISWNTLVTDLSRRKPDRRSEEEERRRQIWSR